MNSNAKNAQCLTLTAVNALEEMKAKDILSMDVRTLSNITDTMIIATGTSQRHVHSLAENVIKHCKKAGNPPAGIEGKNGDGWVLVDLGDIVVHVMTATSRQFYDLERLWQIPESGAVEFVR